MTSQKYPILAKTTKTCTPTFICKNTPKTPKKRVLQKMTQKMTQKFVLILTHFMFFAKFAQIKKCDFCTLFVDKLPQSLPKNVKNRVFWCFKNAVSLKWHSLQHGKFHVLGTCTHFFTHRYTEMSMLLKITKNAKTEKSQNHKNVQNHVWVLGGAIRFLMNFTKHLQKIHSPETPLKKTEFSQLCKNSQFSWCAENLVLGSLSPKNSDSNLQHTPPWRNALKKWKNEIFKKPPVEH